MQYEWKICENLPRVIRMQKPRFDINFFRAEVELIADIRATDTHTQFDVSSLQFCADKFGGFQSLALSLFRI